MKKNERKQIPYEILDYQKYKKRIFKIINDNGINNKNFVTVHETKAYTDCGFPIEHYSIGTGHKHVLVMGGTHGCEIISVDFVTQLMERVAKGEIHSFNPKEFTIDFFPLHNPEGFIISSSAANYKLEGKSEEEIEKFCKEYYFAYRQDDINTRANPDDRSFKLHHKLFEGITVDCIPSLDDRYIQLKEKVAKILDNKMGEYSIPVEALIDWRANGNGVELNGNNPHSYKRDVEEFKKNDGISFGARRFNSIPKTIPGPLGIPSSDMEKFKYEKENVFLFQYLSNLNKNKKQYATFTYHGTGGEIYYVPYDLKQKEEYKRYLEKSDKPEIFNYNSVINDIISQCYNSKTEYAYKAAPKNLIGVGTVLRSVYPAFLLIELSKMGGNPIAPYGDRYGNYERTININMNAFAASLAAIKEIDYLYWQTYEVPREDVEKGRGR